MRVFLTAFLAPPTKRMPEGGFYSCFGWDLAKQRTNGVLAPNKRSTGCTQSNSITTQPSWNNSSSFKFQLNSYSSTPFLAVANMRNSIETTIAALHEQTSARKPHRGHLRRASALINARRTRKIYAQVNTKYNDRFLRRCVRTNDARDVLWRQRVEIHVI